MPANLRALSTPSTLLTKRFAPFVLAAAVALGSPGRATAGTSELLGANEKQVRQVLGEGAPLDANLFNEETSRVYSGGIGSTEAYRVRVGYLRGRACYAFFMKKTGGRLSAVEVAGLLHLCAGGGEWQPVGSGRERYLAYRMEGGKRGGGRTYLATQDEGHQRLFAYSPEWRPDFDRELWVTPDEAPVHRPARNPSPAGKGAAPPEGRGASAPSDDLLPKGRAPAAPSKGETGSEPPPRADGGKEGVYLPRENRVIPARGKGESAGSGSSAPAEGGGKDRRARRGKSGAASAPPAGK